MKIIFDKKQWKELMSIFNFRKLLSDVFEEDNTISFHAYIMACMVYFILLVTFPLVILFILLYTFKLKNEVINKK